MKKTAKIIFIGTVSICLIGGFGKTKTEASQKVTTIKGVVKYFNHHGLKSKDNHNWDVFGNKATASMLGAVDGIPLSINGDKKNQVEVFKYKNNTVLKRSLAKHKNDIAKSVTLVVNNKFVMSVPIKDKQKSKIIKVFKAMK